MAVDMRGTFNLQCNNYLMFSYLFELLYQIIFINNFCWICDKKNNPNAFDPAEQLSKSHDELSVLSLFVHICSYDVLWK